MKNRRAFVPAWSDEPPAPGSYRSIFKWGAPDRFKHPDQRLYEMLKERLNLTDHDFAEKGPMGNEPVLLHNPPSLEGRHRQGLEAIVGKENLFTDDYSRLKYASGKTAEEAISLRQGIPGRTPDLVIHPRDRYDVERIVSYCNEHAIAVYVYGGGSSVNLGLMPVRGGVTLVMNTHMNRVLSFSETNQTITVEPGMMGPDYERILNNAPELLHAKRRYTGGHFPQSFEFSSVGGWIVTLGSGQESSYYGDMYQIVLSQEYVTPVGSFKTLDFPATATGPKVNDMMKGSEGAFGVLVGATLRVFRYMPETRRRFAFVFPSWQSAVEAAREISQGEFGMPSVFRISDPEETDAVMKLYGVEGTVLDRIMGLRGFKTGERCLMLGAANGEKNFALNIRKQVRRICRSRGAIYLTGLPVKSWESGRYTDPYMREDLNDFGIIIDTLETPVTWEKLYTLHEQVRSFIKTRPHTVCLTHASHFYPQGTNLYFIFMARFSDPDEYKRFQEGIIDVIQKNGGSLSHHHGVGKMMAPWMEAHLGKTQMDVLRALKRHFDPNTIMNPGGTLSLDLAEGEANAVNRDT
ncbi:MAG: FAD-binding oxidoreductase [Deltaproteobacteria bacterium]|nr:FAD-binding oxidoreductase [Deltaproteobacteria bacterium]MBW2112432.1 FAD-binding oxidoreductase [Deltaproteobacteria bacterium]